ncbi:hypothetical protein [Paenalcaligenes suwonensis]|uniref:hypothetical protein n=1 Tax=Paenalcaligenes suwonensis TaxID=1202713 RepID=UPI00140E8A7C|nr:hypothetical protein [Paenalcaligenes suwonensis]NHC63198.1 hypothetical protein [Paenalcaligenes suwonensis]
MYLLSELLSNTSSMKSVSEIRLENLETLVKQAGTADSLAERAGLSHVYVSQIRSRAIDAKTGKPRNLGSVASRKIEEGMGKPKGWMDRDHSDGGGLDDGWPFPRVDKTTYNSLSESQKNAIEDWVMEQVRLFTSPATPKRGTRKTA